MSKTKIIKDIKEEKFEWVAEVRDPFLTLLPITLNRIFVNFNHHSH